MSPRLTWRGAKSKMKQEPAVAKIVFNEWYGNLTYAQRACYHRHNVPPAMHFALVERFDGDPKAIVAFVKAVIARKGAIDYSDI